MDFNRDGDWQDTLSGDCVSSEHMVQNQEIDLSGIVGPYPKTITVTTDSFIPNFIANDERYWMRVTLDPEGSMNYDGSGPGYCFLDGETEDYYLLYGIILVIIYNVL